MVLENQSSPTERVDQHLFRPFLDRDFPDLKNIKDFKLESVGGKGENYTTCLLRAKFELELNGEY